jgi:hypothetical protein
MNSLIGIPPSAIRRLTDTILFYFGTSITDINYLAHKAKFEIVHSPRETYGWEFVQYQWFGEINCLFVLERRELETDEIAYFEQLFATSKLDTGTTRAARPTPGNWCSAGGETRSAIREAGLA